MNNYISNIELISFRKFNDFIIDLSHENSRHLILTGKNASGKTSLINSIAKSLAYIQKGIYESKKSHELSKKIISQPGSEGGLNVNDMVKEYNRKVLEEYDGITVDFKTDYNVYEQSLFFVFFDSKRNIKFDEPSGIQVLDLPHKYDMFESANSIFLKYLVNLMADRAFAKEEGDKHIVKKIDDWFNKLEGAISNILDLPNLSLKFDRNTYSFSISVDDKHNIKFNELSDGFSAIIGIISEIIIRMEARKVDSYDIEGVVIIDEIETHLHIDLQKKVLPFLTEFFPGIQFIVTTHSPFVMTSVANATVCDLEKQIVTQDLSNYSYDAIIESYFGSDKYSTVLKEKVGRFEFLALKDQLSPEERWELEELKDYTASAPKYLALELQSKLLEINLKLLTKNRS